MEEYASAFAREIQAKNSEEEKGPAVSAGIYESRHAIAGQIAGIAEEMKEACDFLGEALNFPSSIIYETSEKTEKMQRMEDILLSYAKNPELELSIRRQSEQAMSLIKKVSGIKPGESCSKEESLKEILETYSYFDELSGTDSKDGIDIGGIVSEIEPSCLKTQKIWADELKGERAYATKSARTALEKIADFIFDYSKEGSILSFSSKEYNRFIGITASGSKTKIERASKGLIGSDWRLMLADYIAEKNNSRLEIASKTPSELEITISLQIDKAEIIDDFKARESGYEDAVASIEKRVSEECTSEIREAYEGQRCVIAAYSSAGKEEQEYLNTRGFQLMLGSYSSIIARAKKNASGKADLLSSEIGKMRSELKSATNLNCALRGGLYCFKKRTAERIQEKTEELGQIISLYKILGI